MFKRRKKTESQEQNNERRQNDKGRRKIIIISAIITAVIGVVLYYFTLPALNLQSIGFWVFMLFIAAVFFGITFIWQGIRNYDLLWDKDKLSVFKIVHVAIGYGAAIVLFVILILISKPIFFNADEYRDLISVKEVNLEEEGTIVDSVPKVSNPEEIPIIDMNSAQRLGDKKMGEVENASQFKVNEEYNLIFYKGQQYRITPLEYDNFWKKLKNEGIPGYIMVDIYSNENSKIEYKTFMYSPSASFSKDLFRHLRFQHPTYMFGKAQFEIDEEGNPYYIVPVMKNTIKVFGGKKITSVIVLNAATGETQEYKLKNTPEWVEHVYSMGFMFDNMEYHLKYVNGWRNASILGSKKGVKKLVNEDTNDYSFIGNQGRVYLFNGITSLTSDKSITGFMLGDVRTGKVNYYNLVGGDEQSAMKVAEGEVANYNYKAGYPILVNVEGIPTYYMTLKDKSRNIKGMALVNVADITKSATALANGGIADETTLAEVTEKYKAEVGLKATENKIEGKITFMDKADIEGTTSFYFIIEGDSNLYMSSIENSKKQITYKVGDTVTINFTEYSKEDGVRFVTQITKK